MTFQALQSQSETIVEIPNFKELFSGSVYQYELKYSSKLVGTTIEVIQPVSFNDTIKSESSLQFRQNVTYISFNPTPAPNTLNYGTLIQYFNTLQIYDFSGPDPNRILTATMTVPGINCTMAQSVATATAVTATFTICQSVNSENTYMYRTIWSPSAVNSNVTLPSGIVK